MRPRAAGIGFTAGIAAAVVGVHLAAAAAHKLFYLTQLTMAAYSLLVVLGLALLMGYAGQASMGQAGFFAIGGYVAAFLTTFDLGSRREAAWYAALDGAHLLLTRPDGAGGTVTHLHPWLAALTAVALAALVAWAIAGPVFRLRGHYLAMATLGFGIIVHRVFLGSPHFGGADGISDIPPLTLAAGLAVTGRASARVANYYLAWAVALLALWMLTNLIGARVGRALRAIHGSENAAAAVGIPIAAYKTRVFVLAAVLAAVSGVLLTHYNGGIGPGDASVMRSVRYVAIVAVGGMANLRGTLVMGTVLGFLSLRGYFGTYDDLVFGGILVAMMLFAPEGVVGGAAVRRAGALIARVAGRGRGSAA